ncbi:MAG: selenide, water dikinase [Planctomycetia bacterium]
MTHPDLLLGAEHFSDAGVYRLRPDLAIVQTTDFFPPLVDDPFTFGQIAAANSLSDCYAAGATPITCLNIVGFPDKDLPIEILSEILAGGANKVAEAGAVILGGHSVRDAEIKYGLAVTGTVHPDKFLSNAGAKPGDRLILTKPIGSGVMTSACKSGKISESDLAETIEIMIALNAVASRIAVEAGAHAVTDITGFGLVGHAWEMASASGVTVELSAAAVPLIGPTLDLARGGVLTRAWKSTLAAIGDQFSTAHVEEALVGVLADAQTSGGLLIAVAEANADGVVRRLRESGVPHAAVVGRVTARGDFDLILGA